MYRTLIRKPQRLLLAAVLAGLGTVALAQEAAPAAAVSAPAAVQQQQRMTPEQRRERMAQRQQEWRKHMAERHAEGLAKLKAALAITPAQEGAWSQFAAAMQPPAAPQPAGQPGEWARLTTPERIDRMEQRMAEHQQRVKQTGDAVKAFYAQITPEQQKIFDERAMGLAMHGWGGMHGMHGWNGQRGMRGDCTGPGPRKTWRHPRADKPRAAASQAS
jgi:hypothetical protein